MSIIQGALSGIVSALTLGNAPLYRYPYRNSNEAFRSDWKRINSDIEAAMYAFEMSVPSDERDDYDDD